MSRKNSLAAIVCFSLSAACAAPTTGIGQEGEPTPSAGEPAAPPAQNGSGSDQVTGLAPGAGGAPSSGGAGGLAGAAGAAGAAGQTGSGGTGGALTATPGLEGEWNFDDAGATSTKDTSGHAHHGALVGSGVSVVAGGKVGSALSFAGTSGRVSVPGGTALDLVKAGSIEFWVKLSGLTSGSIVSRISASGDGVRVRTTQGNLQVTFLRASGGSAIVTSDPAVLGSTWVHVAVVNDGASLKLYLNGKLHRSETGGQLGYVSGDLVMGANGTNDSALNGYLDELKWWSVARTNEEICADAGGAWASGECAL